MALNIPLPNFNVQTPDIMGAQEKALTLAALRGNIAMQPLQQQLAQAQVQSAQTANQVQQQKLQSNQAMIDAWKDPDFSKGFTGTTQASASGLGFDPQAMMKSLLYKPDGTPRGVTAEDANAMVNQFVERSKNMAEIAKTTSQAGEAQAGIRTKGFDTLHNRVAGVIKDPAQMPQLLNDLVKNPDIFSGVPQDDLAHIYQAGTSGDMDKLKAAAGAMEVDRIIAENQKAQAGAQKSQLEVAAPTDAQLKTFTDKTIPSFKSINPEQRQAFIAEAKTARTVDEFNKIVERADATDKSEQMHRDSMAMTEALKGQQFSQKGIEENDKLWTDPQHGYLSVASQINATLNGLKQGADGNGLAASMAPTMVVLGVNGFNQTHRISPAEANAANLPGSYAERFNAWADKAFSGKLSKQVADEGKELLEGLKTQAYERTLQGSRLISQSHNVPNLSVFDRDGNLTTLTSTGKPMTTAVNPGGNKGKPFNPDTDFHPIK